MSHRLIRLQPESLSLSGLPIHVARIPAAPFPRAPFSILIRSMRRSLTFLLVPDYSPVDVTPIDSNLLLRPPLT